MTADVVNLRRARKTRARNEREGTAAEHRAAFGRSKAEKDKQAAQDDHARRRLEGHRRDDGGNEGG